MIMSSERFKGYQRTCMGIVSLPVYRHVLNLCTKMVTLPELWKSAVFLFWKRVAVNGSPSCPSSTISKVRISRLRLGGTWQYNDSRSKSAAFRALCFLPRATSNLDRWRAVASRTSSLENKRKRSRLTFKGATSRAFHGLFVQNCPKCYENEKPF